MAATQLIFPLLSAILLACLVLGFPSNETISEIDLANETTLSPIEEAKKTRTIQLSFNSEDLANANDRELHSPRFSYPEGDWWIDVNRYIYTKIYTKRSEDKDELYIHLLCSLNRKSMTFSVKWTSTLLGQKQNFTKHIETSCGAGKHAFPELFMMDWDKFSNPRNGYVDFEGNATTVAEFELIL